MEFLSENSAAPPKSTLVSEQQATCEQLDPREQLLFSHFGGFLGPRRDMADLKRFSPPRNFQIGHISPRTQETAKVAEQKLLRRVDLGNFVE